MLTDLRHAVRGLRHAPGFAAAAALMLGLGIGGSTGVFGIVHAVLLAPLPFGDADRIVMIWERRDTSHAANLRVSGHEYLAWKEHTRVFERMALFHHEARHVTGVGDPEQIAILRVSVDYFPLLQIRPALGRTFAEGEDRSGGGAVTLLSDQFWRRRFGGDQDVLGRPIVIDEQPVTIIGVLPPMPRALTADAWLPIDMDEHARTVGRHSLSVLARLSPGATIDQATADLTRAAVALEQAFPAENTGHRVAVMPVRENLVGEYRAALLALFAAVGLVLIVASANVANLLLTRSSTRQREFAVRSALGASRSHLVRLVLMESVLLSAGGGAIGLVVSLWLMDLAAGLTAVSIPLLDTARLDRSVLALGGGTTLVTGIVAGLGAAFQCSRQRSTVLHEGSRMSEDRGRGRLRSLLVGCEVALALMLLVGAGLMINSFLRLVTVAPGFSTDHALVLSLDLPGSRYPEAHQRRAFVDTLRTRLASLPGVVEVGATSNLPLGGADNWMAFSIEGRPEPLPGQGPTAAFRVVTPGYFRALQIPLRGGRSFEEGDARQALPLIRWFPQQPYPVGFDRPQRPPVAIVSDEAARRFWPGEDPIGRRIRVLFSPEVVIVGIVGDVRHTGLDMPIAPHIYLSHNQEPWDSVSAVIRTSGDPAPLASAVRDVVRSMDPRLPAPVRSMEDVLHASVERPLFYTTLIGLFAAVALGLSAAGISAVVSYSAARRTQEIGVRLALGAGRREVIRLVVGQGMRPVAGGVVAGIAGALALTQFLSTLLYGVEPGDPLTFAIVVAFLSLVALGACWVPAYRASRLDPVAALRTE